MTHISLYHQSETAEGEGWGPSNPETGSLLGWPDYNRSRFWIDTTAGEKERSIFHV